MADQPAVADVITSITSDIKTIVRGEIDLAKAELVPQAKSAGIGAGLFGVAGYLVLNALILLYIAVGFALSALYAGVMPFAWACAAGFGTTALVFFTLAGVLAFIGKNKFALHGPKSTVEQAEQSMLAVASAIDRGQSNVASMTTSNARDPERAVHFS